MQQLIDSITSDPATNTSLINMKKNAEREFGFPVPLNLWLAQDGFCQKPVEAAKKLKEALEKYNGYKKICTIVRVVVWHDQTVAVVFKRI